MLSENALREVPPISAQLIQQTYDRCSSLYDRIFKPWLEFGRREAIEKLELYKGNRVLEIGVGTGLSFEFYPEGVEVIAFDYSDGMLRQASFKQTDSPECDVQLLQMDAQQMAFPSKTFDRIFSAYVMTVVPDTRKAIHEIFRIAKPGARVVFINHLRSNNGFLSWFEDMFHPVFSKLGLFTLDTDLLEILNSCGARDIRLEPTSIFGLHFLISFRVP